MLPSDHRLADGTPVRLRFLGPEDRDRLRTGFERLSPASRYRRFLSPTPRLTASMLRYLTSPDGHDHVAIGAVVKEDDGSEGEGLGVARFVRLPQEPTVAEAAVAVIDAKQGLGLGHLLLRALVVAARERGIHTFRIYVLPGNRPVEALLVEAGARVGTGAGADVISYDVPLPDPDETELRRRPLFGLLRLAARGLDFLVHAFTRR